MKKIILILSVLFSVAVSYAQNGAEKRKAVIAPLKPAILKLDSAIQFIPVTIGPYCPNKLMGGDREFGGHGPEIWASVKLSIVGGNRLVATTYMHARETESDWSETEGTWTKTLYTAPNGYIITEISSGKSSEVHYTSKPGMSAFSPGALRELVGGARGTDVPFTDDGLVTRWNIVGDTSGDDISNDENPKDDTPGSHTIKPGEVEVEEEIEQATIKIAIQ